MPLTAGTRLGPYEVVAPIGAGGMGEVYKATDTRLKRTVAVKVLPPHFALREDLRLRFEREARVISNLNHPHICTLHDIGEQDGLNFLVMEHLEGETLAARVQRGPVALEEALPLAIQIADALSEAHGHAVAHRDLKPANVMLTRTGVKLLDFGLAKPLTAGKTVGPDDATLTAALSTEGAFMGTLQYMAPEQLEGKEADARSDIFAFGCVLYEMLTGKRAFSGESHASVIGAIMSGEPPALTQLQPVTPVGLERIVRQCIRKKADERFQSVHDIKLQLEWLRQPAEEKPAAAAAPPPPPPPKPRRRERWIWIAATSLLMVALTTSVAMRPGPPPPPGPVKLEIQPEERGTLVTSVVVSPDGETIAWNASVSAGFNKVVVRSLSTGVARQLAGVEGVLRGFSADGRSLLFFAGGALKRADISEGAVQTICQCISNRGVHWAANGTVFLGSQSGPLLRVPATGGEPAPATTLDKERGELGQRYPVLLADGQRLLYSSVSGKPELSGVYLASLDGSEKPRRVHPSTNRFDYIPPGFLLIRQGEGVAAVAVDLTGSSKIGEPRMLAESLPNVSGQYWYSSSRDGRVIALVQGGVGISDSTLIDRSGKILAKLDMGGSGSGVGHPDFSPDGKRLVIERGMGSNSLSDIWSFDLERKTGARLTFAPEQDGPAVWSAKGDRVFYYSLRGSKGGGVFQIESNGVGTEKLVAQTEAHHMHVSPDGRYLVFEKSPTTGGAELWMVSLAEGGPPRLLLAGQAYSQPRISPDSRFLAYDSPETGRSELYIQTFPPGGGRWQVSTNGGREPKWRSDGKEIYFLEGSRIMAASIGMRGAALEIGVPHALFELRFGGRGAARHYAASPDGKLFFAHTASESAQDQPVTVLLNWRLGAGAGQ